jgi:hypothetical protein
MPTALAHRELSPQLLRQHPAQPVPRARANSHMQQRAPALCPAHGLCCLAGPCTLQAQQCRQWQQALHRTQKPAASSKSGQSLYQPQQPACFVPSTSTRPWSVDMQADTSATAISRRSLGRVQPAVAAVDPVLQAYHSLAGALAAAAQHAEELEAAAATSSCTGGIPAEWLSRATGGRQSGSLEVPAMRQSASSSMGI